MRTGYACTKNVAAFIQIAKHIKAQKSLSTAGSGKQKIPGYTYIDSTSYSVNFRLYMSHIQSNWHQLSCLLPTLLISHIFLVVNTSICLCCFGVGDDSSSLSFWHTRVAHKPLLKLVLCEQNSPSHRILRAHSLGRCRQEDCCCCAAAASVVYLSCGVYTSPFCWSVSGKYMST